MRWRLRWPASRVFAQPFVQAHIKKISKLRVAGLCEGNPTVTGGFPSQRASNAENASIWRRHYDVSALYQLTNYNTGGPLHSRAACTQPCNVNTHSRAHCSPGARLCEQWGHGCVNNEARLCACARLCRGSPVHNEQLAAAPPVAGRISSLLFLLRCVFLHVFPIGTCGSSKVNSTPATLRVRGVLKLLEWQFLGLC